MDENQRNFQYMKLFSKQESNTFPQCFLFENQNLNQNQNKQLQIIYSVYKQIIEYK